MGCAACKQPARHYVTPSHTHWLLVPRGQDTAANSVNPFLSIPRATWVTQRDLHGAEHWPSMSAQSGGAFWVWVLLLQELVGSFQGQIQLLCSPRTAERSQMRALELNQVFITCVCFWDKQFTEGLGYIRGWCQPSHPSYPSAVVVMNRVVALGCLLQHGCAQEGLMLRYLHQLLLLEMCLLQPLTQG